MADTPHMTPQEPAGEDRGPNDIPDHRPPALDHLEALVGEWEMEALFHEGYFGTGTPAITNRDGRTTFAWLEGKFFLTQRFVNDHPAAPSGLALIGPGEDPESLRQHYYDSRGVERVYQTSFDGHTWKVWREAPRFWQRYTGQLSEDGRRIDGAWEGSADGLEWKHDFQLNYIKRQDG
jgi:hypothetical protein